jgi:SAM-dependent methyltransferase
MAEGNVTGKDAVKAFWESEACGERYGSEQERLRYVLEPQIPAFAGFESATGKRVLEIGVGMGADFQRWLSAGADAVGVDLTERAVELASERVRRAGYSPDIRVGDAERLPFQDSEFDLVYSWGVLHHTPDTERAFAEAIRVLRPGGELRVMIYHRHSWVAFAAWVRFCLLRGQPWRGLRHAVTRIESPGTQAFTRSEGAHLAEPLTNVKTRTVLTHWDRRLAPGVARIAGDKLGWFLLVSGAKPLP